MPKWLPIAVLTVACGSAGPAPAPSDVETETPAAAETPVAAEAPASPTEPAAELPAPAATDPAACDRVRPCAEAFVAVAPESAAASARIAMEQLDRSLVESPARAAACAGAIASFRADLERLEIEVPAACR